MVVEGDGAVEVGEGCLEAMGNGTKGVIGEVAIAIVKGVKKRKERSGLVFPVIDEVLIGVGNDHL